MTVKHLRNVQRQQLAIAAAADSTVVGKYRAGFSECAQEVTRYLSQVDGLSPDTRGRLMQHLNACAHRMQLPVSAASPAMGVGAHPHHHVQVPSATPYASLPGSPEFQQQQHYNLQQQQQQYIAAQIRNMQAAAMAQSSPPHGVTTYTGTVQMVPLSPPESHHQMSPMSAFEAPETAFMRTQHSSSPVEELQSRVHPTKPRDQPNVTSTQLQIEIPAPSPRAQEAQSTTPILKCASPPYMVNQSRDSRIAVNQPVPAERVWRPW